MLINSYNYKYKRKETMVNITQEAEAQREFLHNQFVNCREKDITICNEKFTILICYVVDNKINLKLLNKNTQEIEDFSVVQITNDLTTQKKPNSITLYNSIKTFINKYIKKPNKK
tara:strand:+ start:306 stop:650 length:345 start_codon:yes stop_codon:yes gene_type:complete